jgi:hypothetical protein
MPEMTKRAESTELAWTSTPRWILELHYTNKWHMRFGSYHQLQQNPLTQQSNDIHKKRERRKRA